MGVCYHYLPFLLNTCVLFDQRPALTMNQVVRKVLFDPPDQYERPNEDAACELRYVVRLARAEQGAAGEVSRVNPTSPLGLAPLINLVGHH